MYVVCLTLMADPFTRGADLTSGLVVDLFWALTEAEDHLEHIHVRMEQGAIHLTVFLLGEHQSDAEFRACRMSERVLRMAPVVRGYHLAPGGV